MPKTIVVLQDGETYSGLDQCSICVISDKTADELANGEISLDTMPVIAEIVLKEFY